MMRIRLMINGLLLVSRLFVSVRLRVWLILCLVRLIFRLLLLLFRLIL